MYKLMILWVLVLSLFSPTGGMAEEKLDKLTLAGPFASVSNPLVKMVNSGALNDVAKQVEFLTWQDPDQMRALALNGEVDFIAVPTNAAANLYNKGVDIRLLNVSVWGVLWMVSRDNSLKTLADFKGKEVIMPFRGDMPDIIFQYLAEQEGLDIKQDLKLTYVANPLDAMQMLIMRRAEHALLAEPAVSMALRKTQSFPISIVAPDLYRSVDLQQEWGRVLKQEARIPQAGMAVINSQLSDRVIQRFIEEYAKATQWVLDNPEAAGDMVAERISLLIPEAVADSIKTAQFKTVTAPEARPELEQFFQMLLDNTPAVMGGKLPDDGFYYP
ncbi:MAG: ABC transporter substrate-binding protein [Proteobacteria bacterium]|nr:MAG: ABC transporter substrate-binding protein [Pseudomonadota bacterium]